ncbi:MAG: hypothetical protein OJF49_001398 [Ktedonobacterales bacterium]|nr:MAG: hypothetical protein OJF49_001398 [Ktedonobacterales bacterium]
MTQRSRGGSALLWGLVLGLALAIFVVLNRLWLASTIRHAARGNGGALIVAVVGFVVALVIYFLAGYLAARRSDALESGVFAGMIAGALAGITALALAVIFAGAARNVATAHPAHARAIQALAGLSVVDGIRNLFVSLLIGAGMGALGGLLGRGSGGGGRVNALTPPTPASGQTYQPYTASVPMSQAPSAYPPQADPYTPYTPYNPAPAPRGDDYPTIQGSIPPPA